jgi:hypothetical protein
MTYEIVLKVYKPADMSLFKRYFKEIKTITKGKLQGVIDEKALNRLIEYLDILRKTENINYQIIYVAKPDPYIHILLYLKFDKKNASEFAVEELTYQIRRNFADNLIDMKIDKKNYKSFIDFSIKRSKIKDLIKFLEDLKKNKWIIDYKIEEIREDIYEVIRNLKVI